MSLKFKNYLQFIFLLVLISGGFIVSASSTSGVIDGTSHTSFLCSDSACLLGSRINWKVPNYGTPVTVTSSKLTGDIWGENIGWIRLDPKGGFGGVTNTTGGILSGYAWGENAGWISFNCANTTPNNCSQNNNFKVTINTSTGEFQGYAWSQNYGWIKFNCSGADSCVKTDWRPSSGNTSSGSAGGGTSTPPVNPVVPPTNPVVPPLDPVVPPVDSVIPKTPPTNPITPPTDPIVPLTDPIVSPTDSNQGPNSNDPIREPETTTEAISNLFDAIFNPKGSTNDQGGEESNPGIINNIVTNISDNIFGEKTTKEVKKYIADKKEQASDAINTPAGNATSKATTAAGVVSGAYLSTTTALFVNPISLADIFLIPIRLWGLLMIALGIKKRNLPWGTVYDSVTKQPLDPAYVVLKDLTGREVATSITDLDGRYGFLVPAGQYIMSAGKTNYTFPSLKLRGKSHDELYQDLYFSEVIDLKEGGVISKNIPMDPIKFDWNEFAKKDKKLMKFFSKRDILISRISNFIFFLGFILTIVVVFISPNTYNYIILGVYVLMLVLKNTVLKPRSFGRIKYKEDNTPLSFAIMRIFSKGSDREVIHKVADKTGKYFCLIPNGLYYAKIENKNADESYSDAQVTGPIEVKKGYINKEFDI